MQAFDMWNEPVNTGDVVKVVTGREVVYGKVTATRVFRGNSFFTVEVPGWSKVAGYPSTSVIKSDRKAYLATCKTSPKARKTITFMRYYNSMEDARENCKRVLEVEQGYTVIGIIEAK